MGAGFALSMALSTLSLAPFLFSTMMESVEVSKRDRAVSILPRITPSGILFSSIFMTSVLVSGLSIGSAARKRPAARRQIESRQLILVFMEHNWFLFILVFTVLYFLKQENLKNLTGADLRR
jgi:Ca2+/Na+ antiporter